MSKSIKRKIDVQKKDYFWVLDGNTIDGGYDTHIRIHSSKSTKSILYLDPYNWHFEIRPKTIRTAILFALGIGWNPEEKGNIMYLSMTKEGEFYRLPEGIKFGYLDNSTQ